MKKLATLLVLFCNHNLPAQHQSSLGANSGYAEYSVDDIKRLGLAPTDSTTAKMVINQVHVFDKDYKPYKDFCFKIQYKDLQSGIWLTYKRIETEVYGDQGRVSCLLPAGYYRAKAECLRTGTTGIVPLIVTIEKGDTILVKAGKAHGRIHEYTLQIPQTQYWATDYKASEAEQKRLKAEYDEQQKNKLGVSPALK